jgi:hypothetical protein
MDFRALVELFPRKNDFWRRFTAPILAMEASREGPPNRLTRTTLLGTQAFTYDNPVCASDK